MITQIRVTHTSTEPYTVGGATKRSTVSKGVQRLINGVASGKTPGMKFEVSPNETGTPATGTITCAAVIATNTVTINGVVLTAVTGAPAANQFDRSGTNTVTATNLAAAINGTASALIKQQVSATSSGAVVTVTSKAPNSFGNTNSLASSGATLALTGITNGLLIGGTAQAFVTYQA